MKKRRDECPICHQPRPHGTDLSWLQIAGLFFGYWRGWIWTGAGFVHRRCLPVWAERLSA